MKNYSVDPTSLILIVLITARRDLEIARLLGWYRIPIVSSPKIISVDYLAFYQTKAFGKRKWQIQYIAPVHGYELTTRYELLGDEPDHPRANQEYYKIQIGPLVELEEPIHADKWRRITFLYTTGEHFQNASTINDLILSSEERPIIWQALRERASQTTEYQIDKYDTTIPKEVLSALLGNKKIDLDQE